MYPPQQGHNPYQPQQNQGFQNQPFYDRMSPYHHPNLSSNSNLS